MLISLQLRQNTLQCPILRDYLSGQGKVWKIEKRPGNGRFGCQKSIMPNATHLQ